MLVLARQILAADVKGLRASISQALDIAHEICNSFRLDDFTDAAVAGNVGQLNDELAALEERAADLIAATQKARQEVAGLEEAPRPRSRRQRRSWPYSLEPEG